MTCLDLRVLSPEDEMAAGSSQKPNIQRRLAPMTKISWKQRTLMIAALDADRILARARTKSWFLIHLASVPSASTIGTSVQPRVILSPQSRDPWLEVPIQRWRIRIGIRR